jgi:hypothetical protein
MGSTAGVGAATAPVPFAFADGDAGGDDLADLAQDHVEVVPVGGTQKVG